MPLVEIAAVTLIAPFIHLLAGLLEESEDGARTTSQSFVHFAYLVYLALELGIPDLIDGLLAGVL